MWPLRREHKWTNWNSLSSNGFFVNNPLINYPDSDVKQEVDEKLLQDITDSNSLEQEFDDFKSEYIDPLDLVQTEETEDIKYDYNDEENITQNEEHDFRDDNSENYDCPKCDEKFTKLLRLTKHFNKKHKKSKDPYLCSLCPDLDFENLEEVLDHVRSDHLQTFVESRYQRVKRLKTGGNIQCDFCSKFFDQKKDLKKHVSLAHPDKTNEDDVEEIYENSENSHSMLRTVLK